tara:strand:+ start:175 stop:345 length:171 start_codon:yes stop_codon:yes gene_type:complete
MFNFFKSIYSKIFKKDVFDSLKKFKEENKIEISSKKLPSLDGEWMHFGKNHLNSDI